ncbi:ABC1 kinase family protein [Chondrinema litorale]|uniref:ABC1 kinase family protein n=1 Tax=Chondrinema litorale TaxID=2994555 RepID=UPI0025430FDD|nr:AarF/UbiB family protein [Chondrinema litorale]UZR93876.1 AarF/UbiB family protein [Chondrinema litorale]
MAKENEEVESQKSIPASKVQRAARFMKTGVKVGRNYIKHYARNAVNPGTGKDLLHEDNARDIYDSLSELKGSALKIAQMMSMDKNLLPAAYSEKFQMAQYSAPPLSYPLVVRTFRKDVGKTPEEIFDTFTRNAVNAASIGQVHQATMGDKKFAVKVQYPGVAESVTSDLKMVKPFAVNILGLNDSDVNHYMDEVRNMLLAETDYELELRRSREISAATSHIPHLRFPSYYPEYSSRHILTMDWLDGMHLDAFLKTNPSQEICTQIGQAMWSFYDYQIHHMKSVHADPHPGNFILNDEGELGIIDFGAVKEIPDEFYNKYFVLLGKDITEDDERLMKIFKGLNFIYEDDSQKDQEEIFTILKTMVELLGRPFRRDTFNFGDDSYFREIYEFGEASAKAKVLKESKKPRGARDGLYLNRTYFGLYSILNQLKANIDTKSYWQENSFQI